MLNTHNLPCLLVELVEHCPWSCWEAGMDHAPWSVGHCAGMCIHWDVLQEPLQSCSPSSSSVLPAWSCSAESSCSTAGLGTWQCSQTKADPHTGLGLL